MKGSLTKSSLPTTSYALNMQSCCPCAHVNTMTTLSDSVSNLPLSDDFTVAGVPRWPGLSTAVPPAAAGFRGPAEKPSWRLLLSSHPVWPPVAHTSPSNIGTCPSQAAGNTAGRIAGIGGHGQNDTHCNKQSHSLFDYDWWITSVCVCLAVCSPNLRPVRVSESN